MKLNELIIPNPVSIRSDTTLADAARHMKILDVGILPVCDEGRLVGMLTDRDIAIRGVAQNIDPVFTTVRDVMTEEAIWCREDQDVKEAAELMEKWQIHRLPVLDQNDRLVGIVSLSDLVLVSRRSTEKIASEVLEQVPASGF